MLFPIIVIDTQPIVWAVLSFFLAQEIPSMDNSTPLKQVTLHAREESLPRLGILSHRHSVKR